jgi:cytochrome c oxidase assembly protein subunit 11
MSDSSSVARKNSAMLRKLLTIVVLMAGFGWALIPLYKKICEATGIAQTRSADAVAANTQIDTSRWVTVEFVANNNGALAWQFEPLQATMRVHPGELSHVMYRVVNNTGRRVVGQATASYGPSDAAKHFRKIECFCFTSQTFEVAETRQMPVSFVLSPDLPREIDTVTLSYTFFDVTQQAAQKSANGV